MFQKFGVPVAKEKREFCLSPKKEILDCKILAKISRSTTLLLGAVWGVSLCSAFASSAALRPLSLRGGIAQALPLSGRSASLSPVKMTEAAISTLSAQRCTWQQTMLRIKDPKKSVAFYQEHFGMTLIDKLEFPQYK